MAMDSLIGVLDSAYRIFVFNPETIKMAKEFASGRYEWSWTVLMLGALVLWNVKCWSFFRDERQKTNQTVIRAVGEGILHWCLSNAALFAAIELHKTVYEHFTEYVPMAESDLDKTSGLREAVVRSLKKIRLMNQKITVMPHIRHPQVPFGIMVAASLVVISLAFLVKKPEDTDSNENSASGGDNNAQDVPRGYGWD